MPPRTPIGCKVSKPYRWTRQAVHGRTGAARDANIVCVCAPPLLLLLLLLLLSLLCWVCWLRCVSVLVL